jgi:predicted porin
MKKMIWAAPIVAISAFAHAQSSVTLYGIIDTGITYANHVATASGPQSTIKEADGVASGNRWGLTGQEDLGGGMKAIFTLENGFSLGTGALGQGGTEFGRQAFVGLKKSGVGTFTMGRQYTLNHDYVSPFSSGGLTALGNYGYHPNDLDFLTAGRINNNVVFQSANFNGLKFGVNYAFSGQAGAFQGSLPTTTPSSAGGSSAYGLGGGYSHGPFAVGAAFTSVNFPSAQAPAFSVSIANINTNGLRRLSTFAAGAGYEMGPVRFFGNWTDTHLQPVSGTSSTLLSTELGGIYSVNSALSAVLSDTYSDLSGGFHGRWNQINSALDYSLSKRTDVYLLVVYQKASGSNLVNGQNVPVQAEIGSSTSFIGASAGSDNQFVTRIGLRHKF